MSRATTTLFLRSMPVEVVRAAKAAAARRGSTLAAYVSAALESAENSRAPESGPDLRAEMEWFDRNAPRLRQRYPDEYVAIVEGRVVDHDRNFGDLAQRVFSKFGDGPVFMPRVTKSDRPLRIRSPRISRA
jgi:hypothetical protein